MGGPSTQDYTPVPAEPVEERIDDGVEATREDAEASDDEGLYTTSAPLLSCRTRGNDTPCPHHRGPFRRLAGLFRRPAWTNAKRSKRSWASISVMGFIALLLTTVVALSISTGILSRRPSSCPSRFRNYYQKTHIPLNDAWKSANNRLNFPAVYPPLVSAPSSACVSAWNTLRYIPCHEKIWNRSWDNGKHETLFELDPTEYSGPMCQSSCTAAISRARWLILSQCTPEDKFDMDGYLGPFSADPELESGPIDIITTIDRRLQHTCRVNPTEYYPDHCVNHLYKDWFVVDGMNAGNLEGLDLIESATRVSKTERRKYNSRRNYQDLNCDNNWQSYTPWDGRPERRFGPGTNETSCGWCTLDWFDRKLQSWEEGKVLDPKNGTAVALPEYLQRIRHVGHRCEANDWNRIYGKAIRKYKDDGRLPADWKDDGSNTKPCMTKAGMATDPTLQAKPLKPTEPFEPLSPVEPIEPVEPLGPQDLA